MVFFSKKVVNMLMFLALIALVVSTEAAKTKDETKAAASLTEQTAADKAYFVKFNGILWVSFLFLYIALSAAWMIVKDNAPDTQKDSILYARFLTQNFNQRPN